MIASEKGGRGAEKHRGRSAFHDLQVEQAMRRLLDLGDVDAASRRAVVHGTALHYLEAGRGEAVVLLHGAGGGAANWYRLMRPLAERFRVLAIDLPGFGLSDSIEPRAPLGEQVADLVAGLLRQIDVTPAHIIGTSFGGLSAARLAQRLPPRTLTLIDAAGMWRDAALGLRLVCNPVMQRIPLKQTRRGVAWLFRNVLVRKRLPAEHEAALIEYIYASSVRTDQKRMARAYSLFAGFNGQREIFCLADLARRMRTLIILGEQDHFLPAPEHHRADALAAGARLRIIPDSGHSPNWEAPDAVLEEILNFLS